MATCGTVIQCELRAHGPYVWYRNTVRVRLWLLFVIFMYIWMPCHLVNVRSPTRPPLLFLIGWNHPASITPLWHNLCDCERTSALDVLDVVDVTCFRHDLPHNPTTSTVIKSIDFLFLYRSTAHYYILSTFRQSAACISVLRCIGMWIRLMREWRQSWQAAGGY